jgi:hypothetical protein
MALNLPDRATLEATWQRAEEERAFWDANRARLSEQYPDEFVAVQHGEVVDHDPDLLLLVQRLQARGIGVPGVWLQFMATRNRPLLL